MTAENRSTITEVLENLNGYHEEAIETRFGFEPADFATNERPTSSTRALIFAERMQHGIEEEAAYVEVMTMRLRDVMDYFEDDENEEDGTEPEPFPSVTPAGKDSEPSA